jgi:hypothetical protein
MLSVRSIHHKLRMIAAAAVCALMAGFSPSTAWGQSALPAWAAQPPAWLREYLELPRDLAVDEALRKRAEAMAEQIVARWPQVIDSWIAERRQSAGGAIDDANLASGLQLRALNELALWRVHAGGLGFDAAWSAALRNPALCANVSGIRPTFAALVLSWQAIPAQLRGAHVEAEALLLQRWGKLAQLPLPPVAALRAIPVTPRPLGAGVVADHAWRVPMPPVVASYLLGTPGGAWHQDAFVRCVVLQWGWREREADPDVGEGLMQWRLAQAPIWDIWFDESRFPKPESDDAYPPMAARLGVSGTVRIALRFAPDNDKPNARVVSRSIRVDGVPGVNPIAFQTMLDAASIRRALRTAKRPQPSADAPSADAEIEIEIVWKLE